MEAKLIKTKVGYHLWLNPETKEQEHIASDYEIVNDNGADLRKYKLSFKNCEAIERGYDLDDSLSNFQSLQQTEWDVEIEMEFVEEEQTGTHLVWGRTTPKLDADGCLILKKI